MPEEKEKSTEEKYPSNAYTNITPKKLQDREDGGRNNETEKVKKKFSGKVKKKKLGERIADSFLMADRQDLKEHLFFDEKLGRLSSASHIGHFCNAYGLVVDDLPSVVTIKLILCGTW